MDTQKCKYIVEIAKQKSFSKAAAELFVSQPYLSRLISEIEEEIGVRLFDRGKRTVSLTAAGEYYVNYCKNLILMESNMKSELAGLSGQMKGTIRIGITSANGSHILPPALKEFCSTYPNVQIDVDDGEDTTLKDKTMDGTLDLAFLCLPQLPDQLDYQLIRTEPILLVLPPDHPMGLPETRGNYQNPPYLGKVDIQKLASDPFIGLSRSKGIGLYEELIFRACGITPRTVYTFHNVETALRMASFGNGYTIVPQTTARFVHLDDDPHYFRITLDDRNIFHRSHVAAYRKGRILSPIDQAFISCIRKYAMN